MLDNAELNAHTCAYATNTVNLCLYLKYNCYCYNTHEKMIFSNSLENVEFIWLPSIKFVKDLQFQQPCRVNYMKSSSENCNPDQNY